MSRLGLTLACVARHPWFCSAHAANTASSVPVLLSRAVGRYASQESPNWPSGVCLYHTASGPALCTPKEEDSPESVLTTPHNQHLEEYLRLHSNDMLKNVSSECMEILQGMFGLRKEDAVFLLMSRRKSNRGEMLANLQLLHQHDIPGQQLLRIPWVLSHKTNMLKAKLSRLMDEHMFLQPRHGLGLCQVPVIRLNACQKRFRKEKDLFPEHPNRVYYMAQKLEVDVDMLSEKVGKARTILSMSKDRFDDMTDLFYKYGVSSADLLNDLWVFCYCIRRAEERLRKVADLGCSKPRPWMCRCSDKIFDTFFSRYQKSKELLGSHGSLINYLATQLDCDAAYLESVFDTNVILHKTHITKFSRLIDLLLAEGVTRKEITLCMRVFQYSEERVAARIKELKRVGYFPFPLSLLCCTPGRFQGVVNMHKKTLKLPREE